MDERNNAAIHGFRIPQVASGSAGNVHMPFEGSAMRSLLGGLGFYENQFKTSRSLRDLGPRNLNPADARDGRSQEMPDAMAKGLGRP